MLSHVDGGARRWRLVLRALLLASLAFCCGFSRDGTPAAVAEYQIKAVFLFQFTQFVEWPARAFDDDRAPLVIGVLGDDPFGSYLDEVVRGEVVRTRPIEVRRFRAASEIDACHVLFVSASERARWPEIFEALRGRSILTVGDVVGFTRSDGVVLFTMHSGKVRLKINVGAARASALTISSKLLRSAEIVANTRD